jgi:Trk K+ transport system NAD-binding subunit
MSWIRNRKEIQLRLAIKQNRWLINLLLGWLCLSALILLVTGHPLLEALGILFFLQQDNSHFGFFYASMTDFVVFGLVISVLLVDMQRQVRPEATCRVMAEELTHHAVIFSFTNLGRRTWQMLRDRDIPVTVVDPDPANLEPLIREGYPCLIGTGRTLADLDAVNIDQARLVLVCSEELEGAAVICSQVRKRNPQCDLVARCADDDIGELLSKRYQATVVSTSRVAALFLRDYLGKHSIQHCVLIGGGSLARRMIPILQEMQVQFSVVASKESHVDDLLDKENYIVGRYNDDRILEQAGVMDTELAIFTEDDFSLALTTVDHVRGLNLHCRIVCRVYHDDAADLLSGEPFLCDIFSTSRHAVDQLLREGAFKSLGLKGSGYATLPTPMSERPAKTRQDKPHIRRPR